MIQAAGAQWNKAPLVSAVHRSLPPAALFDA